MKVLILTHGRSGSSALLKALHTATGLNKIYEPFNADLWSDTTAPDVSTIPENSIIKHIYEQNKDWVQDNYYAFDKVIVLLRNNITDMMVSSENALKHGYDRKYTPTEQISSDTMYYAFKAYSNLFKFAEAHNKDKFSSKYVDIIWYEDVFSNKQTSWKVIDSLQLGIERDKFDSVWGVYLNPKHKYTMVK